MNVAIIRPVKIDQVGERLDGKAKRNDFAQLLRAAAINTPHQNQAFASPNRSAQNPLTATTVIEYDQDKPDGSENTISHSKNALIAREYALLKIRGLSDDEIIRFQDTKQQALDATDAKTFLSSLSIDDRLLVQKANSYGRKLSQNEIDAMTEEGARNMLVTQDNRAYVDFNNDGIVDKGVGKTFVFPPPNSPEAVKDAWEKTIEALPQEDRLMASSIFMMQSLQANVKTDTQGNPVGFYFPGEEGYTNIFPTRFEDWRTFLDQIAGELESAKAFGTNNEHIEKDLAIIDSFQNNFYS